MKLKGKGISVFLISIMLLSIIGSCAYAVKSSDANNGDESSIIYVSPNGNDNWNGLAAKYDNKTGNGPKKTIKSALNESDYDGTIKLSPGTYHENSINIEYSVKIEGSGANNTKIDGKRGQVFNIVADDSPDGGYVTIQDLSVENGQSRDKGSAIYNHEYCELTIKNCNFKHNYKSEAIKNYGQVAVENCNFYENTGSAIANYGEMNIKNSDFEYNTALYYGGAIYNENTLTIDNCEFSNNYARTRADGDDQFGGAIFNTGCLDIKKSDLISNGAGEGGAIYSTNALYVEECNFQSNFAEYGDDGEYGGIGGAIYSIGDYLTIENNRFSYNFAEDGGAIATSNNETISNNKFKENSPNDIKILE